MPRPEYIELIQALERPREAQERLLAQILRTASQTAYGRAHGFDSIRSLGEFRRQVPLVRYEDVAPYAERALAGEPDVLVPGRPIFFARTSGTTGAAKHIGYPAGTELEYRAALGAMLGALEHSRPGVTDSCVNITGKFAEATAPSGAPIGSAAGFVRRLPGFAAEPYFHFAPDAVLEHGDFEARYYAMLRFALAKPVRLLHALNPSTLLTLFQRGERYGEALADDLECGTLEAGPPGTRELGLAVAPALTPQPAAAARLRASLKAHGRFMPRDVWPTLDVVQTWKGGAAAHYLIALAERCPGAELWPAMSGSTEGLLAVPVGPQWAGGVPAITSSVLEAFPEDLAPDAANMVELDELSPGRGYRIALTNRRGLYRYVMDDVFVVEGRFANMPVLRFSHRHGRTSSLTGEKLTEAHVIEAATAAVARSGLKLGDFQLMPEWGEPPRYVMVIEAASSAPQPSPVLETFLTELEASLARTNPEYESKRASGRLGPPALLLAAAGHFERARAQQAAARGGSDAQAKIARLERTFVNRAQLAPVRDVEWPGR